MQKLEFGAAKFMLKGLSLALVAFLLQPLHAQARGNDWTVTDGAGNGIQIKNSLFGKKTRVVKDALGDGFAEEKGIFGNKKSEVSLLGNKFASKKGLLGDSQIEAGTIFGDKIISKKGIFGRRKTSVDLSGSSQLLKSFMTKSPNLAPTNNTILPPMPTSSQ
ncbi:MAG: hypothetical protein K2X27_07415 [Candidatus Obscuribacterales bacterium]|nr:hypothetical protein [Candidatus Obscuribacterales bacterium]